MIKFTPTYNARRRAHAAATSASSERELTRAHVLPRRHILRGALGGLSLGVALPLLESLAPREARAQASLAPKRYVQFFWGNGSRIAKWLPEGEGADWRPSELLEPLAPLRDDIAVVSGMEVKVGNLDAHISGPAGFLSGQQSLNKPSGGWSFVNPTLDQQIAQHIGGDTLYRSLEVGAEPNMKGLSFNGLDSVNPPETDPFALYERLFGPTFREPGEGQIDPKLALRRSVLDTVMRDASDLKRRLGSRDRERLEQHLSGIRDLERRLAQLEMTPTRREACVRPAVPELDLEAPLNLEERARLIIDLSAMALACDLTRVVSFWYCDPLSNLLHPGAEFGHHLLTHDEGGDQPQVTEIILGAQRSLAHLIGSLRDFGEGEGTLLDQCALLALTDVSEGRTHQIDEYPLVLAGRAGGSLKMGHHYRSATKESTSHVALSIARALGLPAASYGLGETYVDSGLSAIEM